MCERSQTIQREQMNQAILHETRFADPPADAGGPDPELINEVSVLGSGSTGNAVLLVANGTRVLVDAGMSAREIVRRMALLAKTRTRSMEF